MPSGTVKNNYLGEYVLSNRSVSCVTNYTVRTGRSGNAGDTHQLARDTFNSPRVCLIGDLNGSVKVSISL
jgi:hypothetical protein